MSRYLLVTADTDFSRRLASVTTGELTGDIQHWDDAVFPLNPDVLFAQQDNGTLPEVAILGPGTPMEETLALAAALDHSHPGVSVLLVHPATQDVALDAMRAGVRDVVDPDAGTVEISALLHHALRSAADRRAAFGSTAGPADTGVKGRVISVLSPKGGAGKTTVATNLAIGLAASAPHATVLVDLDLQFGDVANAMQIAPEQSLAEAVRGAAPRDTMVLKSYLSPHPTGVYALCAPDSPAAEAEITAANVTHLLEQLAGEYQYVVIDTAAGLSDVTLAALDKSTDYVFVAGMDVPSIRGLRKELDILKELGMVPAHRHIVLNGADPRDGLTIHDVQTTLGQKADVVVPFSRGVRLSTNQGTPLLQGNTKDRAARELRRLINRFTPAPVPKPKRLSKARHRRGTP